MSKGKLLVLSGPSGVGKGTVLGELMNRRDDMCFSVSATTRQPREGEVDGVSYFFVSKERFEEMIRNNELLEYAQFVSNSYGTPRAYVEQQLEKGFHVILDIEIQGARQVREKMPEAVSVFIVPPSITELRHRLETRGTDTKEVIDARIARARQEIQEADFYDYLIVNDDAALAADRFRAILTAEQCRFDRPTLLRLAE